MEYGQLFDGKLAIFKTRDDIKTSGFLIGPSNKDALVFVHGMGGNFYKEGFIDGARELLSHNISFFSFNTRGAEVVKDFKDLSGEHHLFGTGFEKFEDCIEDIAGALDFLNSLGFENFHLMGHSTGCQKILYYAFKTKDKRVKSLIHISPAEDYEIWKNTLGDDFEKFIKIATEMSNKGEKNKLIIPLYEKYGELWSAQRFLSFANRKNWEAKMFDYESLEVFSKVKIPMFIALGLEDQYFLNPIEWYAEKLKNSYTGEILRIEVMHGDHSFHGYEKELFRKIAEFIDRK